MNDIFLGSFNKIHNHRDCEYLKNECGIIYLFDKNLYKKISNEIKSILGEKRIYFAEDVFAYFQQKYSAFCIDIKQYYNYVNTNHNYVGAFEKPTVCNNSDIPTLSDGCGKFYNYLNDNNEKLITFVIDVIGNNQLRKMYPEIKKFEQKNIKTAKKAGHLVKDNDNNYFLLQNNQKIDCIIIQNIIISVGSLDNQTINSIKILSGDTVIPKINYALEFFRKHS